MPNEVILSETFDVPAIRLGLDSLLLIGRAVREALSQPGAIDSFDASRGGSWIEIITSLGKLVVDREHRISEISEVGDLWSTFFGYNCVKKLGPEARAVLENARARCIGDATAKKNLLGDLQVANAEGHRLVRKKLMALGANSFHPSTPLSIEVFYDESGKEYCAGSSKITNRIRWAYQPVAHGLCAVVLGDFLYAHEYLSHLIPENSWLDSTIREQWLVAALVTAFRDDSSRPNWKNRLWPSTARRLHVIFLSCSRCFILRPPPFISPVFRMYRNSLRILITRTEIYSGN